MNDYLDAFKQYATFSGRTTRKGFWSFYLINLLVVILLVVVEQLLGSLLGLPRGMSPFGPLSGGYLIAVLIPWIALTVRRLHDSALHGAWAFLYLIPFGYLILLVLALRRSAPGDAGYGPPSTD